MRSHFNRSWPLYTFGASAVTVLIVARYFIYTDNFDWPAWVQAVGSITAILVAVWIADRDARARRHESYVIALVAATEINQAIEALAYRLEDMAKGLESLESSMAPFGAVQLVLEQLETARFWSVSEIAQLTPLPGQAAIRIAMAQSELAETKLDAKRSMTKPDCFSKADFRKDVSFQLRHRLEQAKDHLWVAHRDMRQARDSVSVAIPAFRLI